MRPRKKNSVFASVGSSALGLNEDMATTPPQKTEMMTANISGGGIVARRIAATTPPTPPLELPAGTPPGNTTEPAAHAVTTTASATSTPSLTLVQQQQLQQHNNMPNPATSSAPPRTVGVLSMIFFTFVSTSAGPFGIESLVKSAGGVGTIVFVFLVPVILMIPIILMQWELSGRCGLTNHGNVKWVSMALGPAFGFVAAMFQIGMNFVDLATYPVLAANYLTPLLVHPAGDQGSSSTTSAASTTLFQNHHIKHGNSSPHSGQATTSSSSSSATSLMSQENEWYLRQLIQWAIIIVGGVPCLFPISAFVTRLATLVSVLVCLPFVCAFLLVLWGGSVWGTEGIAASLFERILHSHQQGMHSGAAIPAASNHHHNSHTHNGIIRYFGTPAEWQPPPPSGIAGTFATACSIGLWLYVGFLANSSLAGEVMHHRVFLDGQLIALGIDVLMYLLPLLVVLSVHGAWGDGFLAEAYATRFDSPPFTALASSQITHGSHASSSSSRGLMSGGEFWRGTVALAGFVSGFGLYVTSVAMFARTLWGVAHLGWFPSFFARVHPESGVARNAVMTLMGTSFILGLFHFDFLVQLMFVIAAVIFSLFALSFLTLRGGLGRGGTDITGDDLRESIIRGSFRLLGLFQRKRSPGKGAGLDFKETKRKKQMDKDAAAAALENVVPVLPRTEAEGALDAAVIAVAAQQLPCVSGGRLATYGLPFLVIVQMISVFATNILSDSRFLFGFLAWAAGVVVLVFVLQPISDDPMMAAIDLDDYFSGAAGLTNEDLAAVDVAAAKKLAEDQDGAASTSVSCSASFNSKSASPL